jgi:SAM-dependent methyltransferase
MRCASDAAVACLRPEEAACSQASPTLRLVGDPIEGLSAFYEEHHSAARNHGDFVYVPERIPFFKSALGSPGKRILDLGCRAGAFTRYFLEGNHVVGVDVDRVALEAASELGIEAVLADVETELPFPAQSFDAVIVGELLEHVRFPEAVVGEVHRLLQPGGVLVGSVPNVYHLQSRIAFLRGRPPDEDPTHLHMFSPSAVAALLRPFDEVEIAFFGGRFIRVHRRLLSWDIAFRAVRSATS